MSDKVAAAYHGISEEFECFACGEVFLSPISAALCEDRDLLEARQAQREPRIKKPSAFIRSEN